MISKLYALYGYTLQYLVMNKRKKYDLKVVCFIWYKSNIHTLLREATGNSCNLKTDNK